MRPDHLSSAHRRGCGRVQVLPEKRPSEKVEGNLNATLGLQRRSLAPADNKFSASDAEYNK
jgi:hypothetical protein